ncbi:MAG: hypothetical protein ACLTDR_12675 [Adlercreutzia equolifaciens]
MLEGFVGWSPSPTSYGLSWPGGSPGNCGTDAIAAFCAAHETFRGSSADDYNARVRGGNREAGRRHLVFSDASGATVHCAIAGEGAAVYHAWSGHFGTCNVRFDYMAGHRRRARRDLRQLRRVQGAVRGRLRSVARQDERRCRVR